MDYDVCCYGSAPLRHLDFHAPAPAPPPCPMPCSAPAVTSLWGTGAGRGDHHVDDSCNAATASPCFPMGTPCQANGEHPSPSSELSAQSNNHDNPQFKVKEEPPDWSNMSNGCPRNVTTKQDADSTSPDSTQHIKKEPGTKVKQEKITDALPQKKKRDRFNGMSEEEVLKRTLPDHLHEGLDIAIIGINPGLTAAYVGHHYAGPGNHFWKCLYLSGLIPEPMNAYDDTKLRDFGIGFTNIVERTSRGSADLTRKEIKEGGEILRSKIQKYKPKIAVFNGKGIYEIFCGHKNFYIGKQPEPFPGTDTAVFVMPSSSARCSQLPRAVDKVPFYIALKKLRDHYRGDIKNLDDADVVFPDLELKVEPRKDRGDVKSEPKKRDRKRKKTEEPVMFGAGSPWMGPGVGPPMSMEGLFGGNPPGSLVKTEEGGGDLNNLFPPGAQVDGAPYYGGFNNWPPPQQQQQQMNYYPGNQGVNNSSAFSSNIPQNSDLCMSTTYNGQQNNAYPQMHFPQNGYDNNSSSSAFVNPNNPPGAQFPPSQNSQYPPQQFPQQFMGEYPQPPGGS